MDNNKENGMGIRKKINTAVIILKQKGVTGVYDTIRQKIVALSCTDENEIIFEILQDTTRAGVMCDVGAHHGYCLLPFAKAGWQIFAFEPDPVNHSQLLQNTSVYSNVHVDGRAVSDKLELSVPFFTSKESSGVSSLSPFLSSHELAYRVSTTTLGEFFHEQDVVTVDYLKIDTEGFDLMVLQGLGWDQIHPRVIICEFEDSKTRKLEYTYKTLAEYLVDKGYHVLVSEWRPIVKYGEQHAWRGYFTYPHELKDERAWGNLIATNDDELYKQLLKKCKPKSKMHKFVRSA
jgi:FkbM family methyltransferase